MRIIGFGIRWVSSPIRTPSPPQKITTFIGVAPSTVPRVDQHVAASLRTSARRPAEVGIGTDDEPAPHSAV